MLSGVGVKPARLTYLLLFCLPAYSIVSCPPAYSIVSCPQPLQEKIPQTCMVIRMLFWLRNWCTSTRECLSALSFPWFILPYLLACCLDSCHAAALLLFCSVSDPYSFFTDPDPEVDAGDQYGSGYGSGSGSNPDPGL